MIPIQRIPVIQAVLLVFLFFIVTEMFLFILVEWGILQSGWNLFNYCFPERTSHSIASTACQVLIFALIMYSFFRMGHFISKQLHYNLKWHAFEKTKIDHILQSEINQRHPKLRITVINDSAFIAFTKGIFRPKIIISSQVLNDFNDKEVDAILLHEYHHCKKYDPLHLFISSLLVQGFGYIPIVSKVIYYFSTWREIEADRYAIRTMQSFEFLGSVLLRLSHASNRSLSIFGSVGFADKCINYRIEQLVNPEEPIQIPLFDTTLLFKSSLVVAILLITLTGGCL
jgi:beta-lactamase regulating signal transducer with metallopeptidase domain